MNITVRFIKPCVWSFSGNVYRYNVDDVIAVDDKNGLEMVKHDYARIVEDNLNLPDYEGQNIHKERKLRKANKESRAGLIEH